MSRVAISDYEHAELRFGCGYCGAQRGDWCRTVVGGRVGVYAVWLHANRWDQVRAVLEDTGYHANEKRLMDRIVTLRRGLHKLINDGSDDAPWLLIRLRELLDI